MPTLRIFEGSEPTREPADGMLFDRLPIPARRDPRLSSGRQGPARRDRAQGPTLARLRRTH